MAATTYGTAYLYGISATSPSNSIIQGATLNKSDANLNEVSDGTGAVVALRTDDQRDTVELELKVASSFSEPAIGTVLTIVDSGTPSLAGEYMIESSSLTCATKDFKTFKVTATKREYLDLTP